MVKNKRDAKKHGPLLSHVIRSLAYVFQGMR